MSREASGSRAAAQALFWLLRSFGARLPALLPHLADLTSAGSLTGSKEKRFLPGQPVMEIKVTGEGS